MATSAFNSDGPQDRDAVELLAEQFAERMRQGQTPSIDEYVARHPQLAAEIRELFPTIEVLERLRKKNERPKGGRITGGLGMLERLGDFLILREIGRGGMGVVYEAEQQSLGRRVAVKVLPKQFLLDDKSLQRFRREAQTAAQLHHTNIVPVLGVGHDEGYHYYAMQYIRGIGVDEVIGALRGEPQSRLDATPARSFIAELKALQSDEKILSGSSVRSGSKARLTAAGVATATISPATTPPPHNSMPPELPRIAPAQFTPGSGGSGLSAGAISPRNLSRPTRSNYWRELAHLGWQVASALGYAHEHGTLHRDIKPSNLIVDHDGTVWVADFGLAKAVEQEGISRTGDIVGTLRYMAPEQLRGEADPRSDIYSLGLTLYELITLEPAFDEGTLKQRMISGVGAISPVAPRKRNPAVPRDLETIVLKAASPEPGHRYQTSAELAADLRRFIEDRPIVARRASAAERMWRWARRNPAVASLSALTMLLLLAVAVVASIGYVRTNRALARESEQREKSDQTLEQSLKALERVYQVLSPDQGLASSSAAMGSDGAGSSQPVMSKETADLLKYLATFYEQFGQLNSDRTDLREESAKASRRVGDLFLRLGQTKEASDAYASAIKRYQDLSKASGQPQRYNIEVARIYDAMGNVDRLRGRRPEANRSYQQALDILKPLATREKPEMRYELARVYYDLGREWDPRLTTEAVPQGRLGEPGDRPPVGPLGGPGALPGGGPSGMREGGPGPMPSHIGPPGMRPPRGGPGGDDIPPIEKMIEAEKATKPEQAPPAGETAPPPKTAPEPKDAPPTAAEKPVESKPNAEGAKNENSTAVDELVALEEYAEAQPGPGFRPPPRPGYGPPPPRPGFGPPPPGAGFGPSPEGGPEASPPGGLVGGGPGTRPAMVGIAPPARTPHEQLIDADALHKAIALLDELRKEQPSVPEYARLLALCYRELAPGFQSESVKQAVEILTELVKQYPRAADYRWNLCDTLTSFGMHDLRSEDFTVAEERLRLGHEYSEKLDAHVPAYAFTRVHINLKLGTLLQMTALRPGQGTEARKQESLDLLRQAMQLQSDLANEFPEVVAYRMWESRISRPLVSMLRARGTPADNAEALKVLQEAITALEPLAKAPGDTRTVQEEVAVSYELLASLLKSMGDGPQADEATAKAAAARRAIEASP